MKMKPLISAAFMVTAGACLMFGILRLYHVQEKGAGGDLFDSSRLKILSGVDAFYRDQKTKFNVRPAKVPLRELISSGYIRADEVRGLDGMEITVELEGNVDSEELAMRRAIPGRSVESVPDDSLKREGNEGPEKLVLRWDSDGQQIVAFADVIRIPGGIECTRFSYYSHRVGTPAFPRSRDK